FLQRSGEHLRLKFKAHHYGPYSVQLNHVLLYLNGVYLKGLEQNITKPFDPLFLNYDRYVEVENYVNTQLSSAQRQRLTDVLNLLKGFESAFSLELLSTVDYLTIDNSNKDVDAIIKAIAAWSNRKTDLFQPKQIQIAYNHLQSHAKQLMT
ncbi:MAG: phosphatase, partial [Bacteroidota bacterium]